jgi:hypothetical protein
MDHPLVSVNQILRVMSRGSQLPGGKSAGSLPPVFSLRLYEIAPATARMQDGDCITAELTIASTSGLLDDLPNDNFNLHRFLQEVLLT